MTGQRETTIRKIQEGNTELREQFISEYKPFILRCTSKYCGRFIEVENDEEFSIGLLAFNEAIDAYKLGETCSFIGFAGQVIQRRLIDYARKNKNKHLVTFDNYAEDTEGIIEQMIVNDDLNREFEKMELSQEILSLESKLEKFKITFHQLVSSAPKHWDSKIMCIGVARLIVGNPIILSSLEKTGNIPVKELLKMVNISKRTVEKNRKYIIALCLVMNSELDLIKSYILETEKGGRIHG